MDCSLPGSSVHGILQARILEWVATSFSRESSRPRNQTQVSCIAGMFFTNWALREALFFNIRSDQSLSRVQLFATPWIAAHQASLSITNSRSLPKLMSIESVMPSSHLILCRPLLLLPPNPSQHQSFQMSQLFPWGGQSTGVSALASVLPKKSQDWSPLEWTGWISLQSKELLFTFLLKLLMLWPLCIHLSGAGLPWHTHTHQTTRAPEHMVLSQAGTPGQPWPSSREGIRPSPLEEGVGTSLSAPRPRRLLCESEVLFTHRNKGSPVEYTNHKFWLVSWIKIICNKLEEMI